MSRRATPAELRQIDERQRALRGEGLLEEAEAVLRDAVRRFPDEPSVCGPLAVLLTESDPEESKALTRQAVAAAPGDPETLVSAAHQMVRHRELAEARALLLTAREVTPEDSPFIPEIVQLAGRVAWEAGNHELAEGGMAAAFEQEPDNRFFGGDLAEYYLSRERAVDALRVLSEVLRHHPHDEWLTDLRRQALATIDASNVD